MACPGKFAVALVFLSSSVFGFRLQPKSASKRAGAAAVCSSIGCGAAYNRSAPCQCNEGCQRYGNCCSDYVDLCLESSSCSTIGCGAGYDASRPCQCNFLCSSYDNCCSDYSALCLGGPSPTPSPPTSPPGPAPAPTAYWVGVDLASVSSMQARMRQGVARLSYSNLWNFYKSAWVDLPGACQGRVYDVYSRKCWTPGTGQCGSYQKEGDCYNREHSWPKSWWGGSKIAAYSDVFHVMPSDGFVNSRRSNHPFGEVTSPKYTSSEGNKVGPCSTPGISGTCFEPADRVKGTMARGHFYMSVRYLGEISRTPLDSSTAALMLKWHVAHPPQAWEVEFNERAYQWQKNRNPFIDFPESAHQIFR